MQILDKGTIWSEGSAFIKVTLTSVSIRLEQAVAKSKVDFLPPLLPLFAPPSLNFFSLSFFLWIYSYLHTISKLIVHCFSLAIHLGISKNGASFP